MTESAVNRRHQAPAPDGVDRGALFASGREITLIAMTDPDRPALISDEGVLTFVALERAVDSVAAFLAGQGLVEGDVIALLMTNRTEWVVVYLAALRAGMTLLPLNWHLQVDDVSYILRDSGAVALFTESSLAHLVSDHAHVDLVVCVDQSTTDTIDWDTVLATNTPSPIRNRGRQMIYTSGSTGRPKGVRHSPSPSTAAQAIGDSMVSMFDMRGTDGDLMLCPAPLYHSGPSRLCCEYPLGAGVGVVLMNRFDAGRALDLIERHHITHAFFVPTMFSRMLAVPDRDLFDVSSLRFVVHGAGPCSVSVKQAMFDWIGPVIHEIYAATEGPGTWITPHEWIAHPGSVGRIDPTRLEIRDDSLDPVPPETEGTVWFLSTTAFEYHGDPDKTRATYDESGRWYTVGDRGRIDRDGYLYLSGRTSECIISGGVNIYPARIDEALATAPGIVDGAAFGVPDEDLGEIVAVAVVPTLDVDAPAMRDALVTAVIEHCRNTVGTQMAPRAVFITDELPRSDAGKLYRRRLVERFSS